MLAGWWGWMAGYAAVLAALHVKWMGAGQRPFWTFPQQKSAWWLAISLASSSFSISNAGLISSVIGRYGPDGVFFIWSGMLGIGIFPIIFAPLWSRLQFISENEFILMRFRGTWSHHLFWFRSLLLTGVVIPILLAFIIVATRDLLGSFVEVDPSWTLLGLGAALGVVGWNASLYLKSRVDMLHFIVLLVVMLLAMGGLFLGQTPSAPTQAPSPRLLPIELIVFIGLQWWSAEILDGSGMHAQSLLKQGNLVTARRGALGGHALTFLLGAVIALIAMYAHRVGGVRGDDAYLQGLQLLLPTEAYPLLAIALFGMGMSTASGLLNWGSGMVAALLPPATSETKRHRLSKLVLVGLAVWSTGIAFHLDSLLDGIQLVLAITAGVGPVFLLRWFWWRITAQVQLAAMLGVYLWVPLAQITVHAVPSFAPYEFAAVLALATAMNSAWWLGVAFLTNSSADRQQFSAFRQVVHLQEPRKDVLQVIAIGALAFLSVLLLHQILLALEH